MQSQIVEVLHNARALLSEHWTQGHYARDAKGWPVSPNSVSACSWCMVGAVRKFCNDDTLLVQNTLIQLCTNPVNKHPQDLVVGFNDSSATKLEDVLKRIDDTIQKVTNQNAIPNS